MKYFEASLEPNFWTEAQRNLLPPISGIYMVYSCDYNALNNTVYLKEILYIGETENIFSRHNITEESPTLHEHYPHFIEKAHGADHVCYGVIPYNGNEHDRKWLQDALIHMQQPEINVDGKLHYNEKASEVRLYGDPSCWKMTHFKHKWDYRDEIEDMDIMTKIHK